MQELRSKLPNIGTTIFTVMSAMANEYQAINLGQGFPDYAMDTGLQDLVTTAMQNGNNQYAPMQGVLHLRRAIAERCKYRYGKMPDPEEEITITPGGTYALFNSFATIIERGDEVIVFDPVYDSYIPSIELFGGNAVRVPIQLPQMKIDWEKVRSKINATTRAIVINSPHNPTGMVLNEEDMLQLQKIVLENDLFLISDEVYEFITFDKKPHLSVIKYPHLFQRSFVCFSFGKTYHCTGWKLGYCIAPPLLTKEMRKVHQFNCFSCHTPMQIAFAEWIKLNQDEFRLAEQMQRKRDMLRQLLSQTALKVIPSSGSYFEMYDYSEISNEPDHEFAELLVKKYGVATIPLSAFWPGATDKKILRFCFAKKDETLRAAAERLQSIPASA